MEHFLHIINPWSSTPYEQYGIIVIAILSAFFSYFITRYLILDLFIIRLLRKTNTQIDDILIDKGFFNRLSYVVPLVVFYYFKVIPNQYESALFAIIILLALNSLISAMGEIYFRSKYASRVNIKSYIQIFKLIVNLLGIIVIIAFLLNKSPLYLLSGLGALTAVLMLIFKDTILSFVSSIQITSNNLFKVGDWVEAPQFGADGDVIDIALHTIKIQNWDKTISIIPTNKLVESSFKNWKGMSESGGRRIKRSIFLDLNSVRFCNSEMIEKFKKIDILRDYINDKILDIENHNESKDTKKSKLNGRSLTNIGTYRAYIQSYLRNSSSIHQDMTFLIRQLSPGKNGLPLEIYVFSNNTDWVKYESIQSDIFDHLIASVSEFDLTLFQNPTGKDFSGIK
jgi:miniconductance mechanosensitive channel